MLGLIIMATLQCLRGSEETNQHASDLFLHKPQEHLGRKGSHPPEKRVDFSQDRPDVKFQTSKRHNKSHGP